MAEQKYMRLVVVLMLVSLRVVGQGELIFPMDKFDFGRVSGEGGQLDHEFLYINQTAGELRITDVSAACDCIIGGWSNENIAPGDSGYVSVSYFPSGRLGSFSKEVRVTTSTGVNKNVTVMGDVVYDEYELRHLKYAQGALLTKNPKIGLGQIALEDSLELSFLIKNGSENPITFDSEAFLTPKHLSVLVDPKPLAAGEVSELVFVAKPKGLKPGYREDQISLFTDEAGADSMKTFYLTSIILPKKSSEAGARITVDRGTHDFGMISQGNKEVASFQIINSGKDQLEIIGVQSNCECIVVSVPKKRLQSFEKMDVEVAFETEGRQGNQYKSVTFYTNDPDQPAKVIYLKARIQD